MRMGGKKYFILGILLVLMLLCVACGKKEPTLQSEQSTEESKLLTMAVFQSVERFNRSDLGKWVTQYNETQSDVIIEVVNYLEKYPDMQDALNQIKIEINAGKGPDMINFGSNYSPLDASCGMLTDLNELIQQDATYPKQELYRNVMDAFGVGDGLYVLVPAFHISTFATVREELAGKDRVSVQELVEIYKSLEEGVILFPGETKSAVFGMLCYGGLQNYIDWDKGTCTFDSESFRELLVFADSFPLELNISEDYSAKKIFEEGKALLFPTTISNVYGITYTRLLYGEIPAYIGYPFDEGNGNLAGIEEIAIGISATSKEKEAAWSFMKTLLGKEFQDGLQKGLPVRKSSLEDKLTQALEAELDGNGEKVPKDYLIFDGEDPVEIYEISMEDAEELRKIIEKVQYNDTMDLTLYNILLEEAEYLFHKNRDVENVADVIQNRAGIYISEGK